MIVPDPNFCVWPVTVWPLRPRSVVIVPEPNGLVSVVVPSDQRVTVPLPNFCVWPVTVLPSRPRSVVIEPEPNGLVWLLVPSDLWVMVPEPNPFVVPERGCVMPARGGVGSTAMVWLPVNAVSTQAEAMQAQITSLRRKQSGLRMESPPEVSRKSVRGKYSKSEGVAVLPDTNRRGLVSFAAASLGFERRCPHAGSQRCTRSSNTLPTSA